MSSPYVSAQGHNLLDVKFCESSWCHLNASRVLHQTHFLVAGASTAMDDLGAARRQLCKQSCFYVPAAPDPILCSTIYIYTCKCLGVPCPSCATYIFVSATADGPLKLFGEQASYQKIAEEVESLDGVITHGLFVDVASTAAVFTSEGVDLVQSTASVS